MPMSQDFADRLYPLLPEIRRRAGTPVYVYYLPTLESQARLALDFPAPFGLRVRFALKSCPNKAVVRALTRMGIDIDASSGFEVHRALRAGVSANRIMLTAQEIPDDFPDLVRAGVIFNACSLRQLEWFGRHLPGGWDVGVRMNPGLGSGHSRRTNVGGPSSSFGIWHGHLDEVLTLQQRYRLSITRLHSHIGSGSDPDVWERCASLTLGIAEHLPDVTTVNLGGGFKVGRMLDEKSTDFQVAGASIAAELIYFAETHGRRLDLEIEPGTFFVANAGVVVASVIDVVDTGPEGFSFIKVDSGMTEILRPSLYGAQHPITVVPPPGEKRGSREYLVVGHCCESGDTLTPAPGNPESLQPRLLTEAKIGDIVVIGGTGAYCAGMPAKNYNSFPEAPEVLLDGEGNLHLIRERQTLDQMLANERMPDFLK